MKKKHKLILKSNAKSKNTNNSKKKRLLGSYYL